ILLAQPETCEQTTPPARKAGMPRRTSRCVLKYHGSHSLKSSFRHEWGHFPGTKVTCHVLQLPPGNRLRIEHRSRSPNSGYNSAHASRKGVGRDKEAND